MGFSAPYKELGGKCVFLLVTEAENCQDKSGLNRAENRLYFFFSDFTGNLKPLGNVILNQSQTLCLADMKYFIFRLFNSFKNSV